MLKVIAVFYNFIRGRFLVFKTFSDIDIDIDIDIDRFRVFELNINLRLTLRMVFLGEAFIFVSTAALAWVFEPLREFLLFPSLLAICYLFWQLPIAWLKGLDYIIQDEDPDSPLKYYFFFSIFAGTYMSATLNDILFL